MSTVTVTRVVPLPRAEVFAVFADFGRVHRFHPAVASSPVTASGPDSGVGCERVCTFYDGNTVHERVTGQVEDTSMSISIYEGSLPLKRADAQITFADDGDGTRIEMTMDYELKYGIVGTLMDSLMMRSRFESLLGQLLEALEVHMTTGQDIGPDWKAAA